MRKPFVPFLVLAAVLVAAFVSPALAQQDTASVRVLDSGRLLVFSRGTPVGVEDFQYERRGDSVLVTAMHTRHVAANGGKTLKWVKKFGLIVGVDDAALHSYFSNLEFDGHVTTRGIVPGDTAMTIYSEFDGNGDALRITQPPGRYFIMDPMLFTLFDVVCRAVSERPLARRPIELVSLGEQPGDSEATVSAAGADTITWGGKRTITKRWLLEDANSKFVFWSSPAGQMLRLLHEPSGLEVLREEPAAAKVARPAKAGAGPRAR